MLKETAVKPSLGNALLTCGLMGAGTVLGLSGIDLVLPAIPELPEILGGDEAAAQLVLATYIAGTAIGLLLFGALGSRFGRRWTLVGALSSFALLSFFGGQAETIDALIVIRFFQGIASSAPAVFAPGIIRALFDEAGSTKAIGALGSIESLVPAAAPLVGVWLIDIGGWQSTFYVTAILAAILALAFTFSRKAWRRATPDNKGGGFSILLTSPIFLRYALSQALVLGGLLVFVLAAPAVIVRNMGGEMSDFILMQIVGVSCFIVASNTTGFLVDRWGAERLIMTGTIFALASALALFSFAIWGNDNAIWLPILFAPMTIGLGLRGPPGFLRAIIAGRGDDDRASSLTILAITCVSAGGTAFFAPFVTHGLAALCLLVSVIEMLAVVTLLSLPGLEDTKIDRT